MQYGAPQAAAQPLREEASVSIVSNPEGTQLTRTTSGLSAKCALRAGSDPQVLRFRGGV